MKPKTFKSIWWSCFIFAMINLVTMGLGLMEICKIFVNISYSEYTLLYWLFIPDFIALAVMLFCENKFKIEERGFIL